MVKSKRNILDKDNGFNVMINLFIIRYLYSHMDKANVFNDDSGERKKSIDFHSEVVGISRPRMGRILKGENFEMSSSDKERLSCMFNFEQSYFDSSDSVMKVHLLEEIDWQCFFMERYYVSFDVKLPRKIIQENEAKVTNALKRLVKKGVIENEYETSTPIYRVYYYFKNGSTYKDETRLTKFIKALADLRLSDWEEIEDDTEQLERYKDLLMKHTNYVKVVTEYKHIKGQ